MATPTPIFGDYVPPISGYSTDIQGLTALVTNFLRFAFLLAGIWAFFNFIVAGYDFLAAGGDPKHVVSAWSKIWQTVIGLIVIVASFILAAIIGYMIFNDPLFILKPRIYGPGP